MVALALALHLAVSAATPSVPKDTPVHLGIALKLTNPDELNALKHAQVDPRAREYRQWLTPQEFGARFGQSTATLSKVQEWLRGAGFTTEVSPNHTFINAYGTAGAAEALFHVKLLGVEDEASSVHRLSAKPQYPANLASVILGVSGLDTRVRLKHHMKIPGYPTPSFGPQDLRRQYNAQTLHDMGFVGQNLKTVVLSTALAPGTEVNPLDIQYFYQNISDVKAPLVINTIFNPSRDYDRQRGGASEFELDLEMHSVGVPGAAQITLEVSPASQVFTVGANDIVNNFADAAAVSVSLGLCEAGERQNDIATGVNEIKILQQAVIQGTMEGQTWSAASGDNGANDCGDGSLSVDFPSTIPEMIAAGGSEPSTSNPWNANGAILMWTDETTWNDGSFGGAAGGGISSVFALPDYQAPLMGLGTMRMTPDIALIAGGPGVVTDSSGLPGQLDPVLGTSVASPLSAGFFALIASYQGCRLGDPHAALYQLGLTQADGGTPVFHDITTGNNSSGGVTGPSAGPGFDMASGWGAFDVAAMAAAWPGCPTTADGGLLGLPDGGPQPPDAGIVLDPYDACTYLNCGTGTTCTTIPDGPSACVQLCNVAMDNCPIAQVCNKNTIYAPKDAGTCIPGCASAVDCVTDAGQFVCSTCEQICVAPGSATAAIGDPCTMDTQCPNGAYCSTSRNFPNGYCTMPCALNQASGAACSCPAPSECGTIGRFPTNTCLAPCSNIGDVCRAGYKCQPQTKGVPKCLAACTITTRNGTTFDSCMYNGSGKTCDTDSGICGGPVDTVVDAGPPPDAGQPAIDLTPFSNTLGAPFKGGCGCGAGGAPFALALLALVRRRRARN
jgi:hypothetical protein